MKIYIDIIYHEFATNSSILEADVAEGLCASIGSLYDQQTNDKVS